MPRSVPNQMTPSRSRKIVRILLERRPPAVFSKVKCSIRFAVSPSVLKRKTPRLLVPAQSSPRAPCREVIAPVFVDTLDNAPFLSCHNPPADVPAFSPSQTRSPSVKRDETKYGRGGLMVASRKSLPLFIKIPLPPDPINNSPGTWLFSLNSTEFNDSLSFCLLGALRSW